METRRLFLFPNHLKWNPPTRAVCLVSTGRVRSTVLDVTNELAKLETSQEFELEMCRSLVDVCRKLTLLTQEQEKMLTVPTPHTYAALKKKSS